MHAYVSSARTTSCKGQKIRLQNIVMTHAAESKPMALLCAFNFRDGVREGLTSSADCIYSIVTV